MGLVLSCFLFKYVRFVGLNFGGGFRVRVYVKFCVSCVVYERGEEVDKIRSKKKNVFDFGFLLVCGR